NAARIAAELRYVRLRYGKARYALRKYESHSRSRASSPRKAAGHLRPPLSGPSTKGTGDQAASGLGSVGDIGVMRCTTSNLPANSSCLKARHTSHSNAT